MALSLSVISSGANVTATGNWSSGTISITSGRRLIIAMKTVGNARTHTITGPGDFGTFTKLNEGQNNTNDTISWHTCVPVSTSNVAMTFTPSGSHSSGHWCIIEAIDEDTTTPFPQTPTIATGTGTTFSKSLGSPVASTSRSLLIGSHNVFQGLNAGTNMSEMADHPGNSPATSFWVGKSDGVWEGTPSCTAATSGNWGALALEVAEVSSGTNVNAPAFVTADLFPTATVTASADTTPASLFTDDVFPSASLSATAAVTPTTLLTADSFPASAVSAAAGVTPTPLLTSDIFPSATVTGQANVTFPVLLTDDEFPSVTVTTGVEVIPTTLLTADLFPQVLVSAEVLITPLLTDDVFPGPSFSATGSVTPTVLLTTDAFPAVVITSSSGISAPVLVTADSFPAVSITATAGITPTVLLTDDEFPAVSVTTPGEVPAPVLITADLFPAASFSTTSTATPTPLLTVDLFPGASVSDGTSSTTGKFGGITWINEPWLSWPVEEEALVE